MLTGEKSFVLDGHVASHVVVVPRSSGAVSNAEGITLVIVPTNAANLQITRTHLVDGRNAARVTFTGVAIPPSAVLGVAGGARATLDMVLDRARIGLAAEMLGALREAFEQTLVNLKARRQFGVPIGSFQALKHRAAASSAKSS